MSNRDEVRANTLAMADYDDSRQTSKQVPTTAAPAPKPKSHGHFYKVLGGKPKGKGAAEITIATKGADIEVGMKGLLLGHPGSFQIVGMRGNAAIARLEGSGVEKLAYSTLLAIIQPSTGVAEANTDNIEHPRHIDLDEARRRYRPGSGGGSGVGGGPR